MSAGSRLAMDEYMQNQGLSGWRRILIIIFSAALLIRLVFILTLQDGLYFADAPIYSAAASHLVEHGEFPANYKRAPLYPLFLAGVYGLAGESFIILRIVQAVLGACIAVLIAVIGKRAGSPAIGAIAGIVWGIYPMGVFIAGLMYPTTLLTVLLACGVLCLVTRPDDQGYPVRVALAGLLFGLSALAKPIVLGTIVFVAFWIVFWSRSGRIFLLGIFLFTTVTVLLPWTVRNAYVYDQLVPIEARGLHRVVPWADAPAAQGESGNATWTKFSRIARRFPREFVSFFELDPRRVNLLKQSNRDKAHRKNPDFVKHTSLGSSLVNAVSIVSVVTIFTFALAGMRAMWRERDKHRELSLLVLLVMSFALGYAISWGKIRYRVPVDPYIIILSAWGVMYVWHTLVKRRCVPG